MIIDSHIHLGAMSGLYNYDSSYDRILQVMEELGIAYAVSSHNVSLSAGDIERGEALSTDAFTYSRGKFLAYHLYDPRVGEQNLTIIRRYHDPSIFVGVKLHPSFHYTDAGDERYRPIWEYAREKGLPILSHTWDLSPANPKQRFSFPAAFEKYIAEYPEITFIMGHSGGRYKAIQEAVRLGLRYPNVMYDIAGDIHIADLVEFLVGSVGDKRVLYGSDCNMMDQRTMLGAILGADIPLAGKEKILYHNAACVFRLKGVEAN